MADLLTPTGWTAPPVSPTAKALAEAHRDRLARLWKPRRAVNTRPKLGKAWLYSKPIGPQRPKTLEAVITLEAVYDHKITLNQIVDAVIAVTGIPRSEIDSLTRTRRVSRARHLIGYVAKVLTNASYQQIGKICGNRDHSSALHGVHKVRRSLPQYLADVDKVLAHLGPMAEAHAAYSAEQQA